MPSSIMLVSIFVAFLFAFADGRGRTSGDKKLKKVIVNSGIRSVSESLNNFGLFFHNRLAGNAEPGTNIVTSPFSAFTAFSAVCLGAKGATREEMMRALKWKDNNQILRSVGGWYQHIAQDSHKKGAKLLVANKLWISDTVNVLRRYRRATKKRFKMRTHRIDVGRPEQSRKRINDWVKRRTASMIPELFPRGTINSLTKLILANAIYFRGKWANKFNKDNTAEGLFCTTGTCTDTDSANSGNIRVKYMIQKTRLPVVYGEHASLLELAYTGNKLSMFFVMPRGNSNITELEKRIDATMLQDMIKSVSIKTVRAYIPKFKIKYETDLTGDVMNMSNLFDANKANLTGISRERGLYVSKAVHKTVLKVDETGTEAAAVTGIHIMGRTMTPTFKLNRPFLFFVIHKSSGAIIFSGKVMNPNM